MAMQTKILIFLVGIALLSSCTNEIQDIDIQQSQPLKRIVMTTQGFEPEVVGRTLFDINEKAIRCTWATNDTVGVFPEAGAQAYFPMASGAGTNNATFDGGGWDLKDGNMYAAYYPCIGEFHLDRHAIPVNYTDQIQTGNASAAHLGAYDYMVATPTTSEFGSVLFTFKHLSALVQLRITVPQPATLTSVKLVTDTESFAVKGSVDIIASTPSITPVTSTKEVELKLKNIVTTKANQVVTLYLMIPPVDLSAQKLKAVITTEKGVEEIALESKNFRAGTIYTFLETDNGTIVGNDTYRNGVVSLSEAGYMELLLGWNNFMTLTSLKVIGPINGDDVRILRKMLGCKDYKESDWGRLATLDLSEATIVEGGESYYNDTYASKAYYTSNYVIGDYMFNRCNNLRNIVLPNNTTMIGDGAFVDCSFLKSVTVGENMMTIGNYAFRGCDALTSFDIPDKVTTIGHEAFDSCKKIVSVTIGDGVTAIGESAFRGCRALASIDIPDNVISIGESAFAYCRALVTVTLGNGATAIGESVFEGCRALASIDIPDNVISIGKSAFEDCI